MWLGIAHHCVSAPVRPLGMNFLLTSSAFRQCFGYDRPGISSDLSTGAVPCYGS